MREEPGLRIGVGNDEIGRVERATVDGLEHACNRRTGAKTRAVGDQRVGEGDERVEHDRPSARRTLRRRQIEMPWIADDDGVRVRHMSCKQPRFRHREPRGGTGAGTPAVADAVPDGHVDLVDLNARPAQARDHLCVARVLALVRPEVRDLHRGGSARPDARAKPARPLGAAAKSAFIAIAELNLCRDILRGASRRTRGRSPHVL